MSIEFIGYHADKRFRQAYEDRSEPMELEKFYEIVNSPSSGGSGGCSCCNRDVTIYAVEVEGVPQIKPEWLSLCVECVGRLPEELVIANLGSNGVPPVLRVKV